MKYDIIIIGGGASGLMLASALSLNGRRGIILEKNCRPGMKLLLTGGGRCNITHGGSIKDFPSAYGNAGRFLRRSLYRHSNLELAAFLADNGMRLADENGRPIRDISAAGRLFPSSLKASDVLELLLNKALSNGWTIRSNAEVTGLSRSDGEVLVSLRDGDSLAGRSAVAASGGITFPETGSDGALLEIIGRLGVGIVPPRSALAPVSAAAYPYSELSGMTLTDVTAEIYHTDSRNSIARKEASMTGDLLFTHRSFSGPVILNISRYAYEGAILRLRYNRLAEELPKRLLRMLEERSRGSSGDIRTKVLAGLLEHDDFIISGVRSTGMATAGGISLSDVDPSTMKLKSLSSPDEGADIYAIGEALDCDGITGGYNLQMCWSTAGAAADSLRESIRAER